jgi:hypothetical protein
MAYSRIPYATEQEISKSLSGNLFRRTGNFYLRMVGIQPISAWITSSARASSRLWCRFDKKIALTDEWVRIGRVLINVQH